ncbi:response regulator [Desulfosoma caldarium]|uniref:hypothetical protein n=1 Tax=Desulfosoma caldarium TaxID=610254 RepID=UPI000F4AF09B|nr:hypothetical protein [Desulfosoma caldarium]
MEALNGVEVVETMEMITRNQRLILDLVMPEMNHWQTHQALQTTRPEVLAPLAQGEPGDNGR